MGEVIALNPKPRCTNTTRCTHDDCPLKAAEQRLEPGYFLGNCSRYLAAHAEELKRAEQRGASGE